jgi:hypothetical protein
MVMVKLRGNFERVRDGLYASRDGGVEERARLNKINGAIMTLPEAVRPWAKKMMFSTNWSAAEILEAAKHVPGGQGSSTNDAQLGALGRTEAQRLLGKIDDPFINFSPVEANVKTFDIDSDLAKAGAETARALKAAGYLSTNLGGLGVMA